jgi:uncharacterized membrane protein
MRKWAIGAMPRTSMSGSGTMQELHPVFPDHVQDTVAAMVEAHRAHHKRSSSLQRLTDRATAYLAKPLSVTLFGLAVLLWIGGNLSVREAGGRALDEPPFAWLELAATLASLFVGALILVTQRRENRLAVDGAQLTLELALVNERKSAKIIALLEELRSDSPDIVDRVDNEATAMAEPADAHSVLAAIQEQSAEAEKRE